MKSTDHLPHTSNLVRMITSENSTTVQTTAAPPLPQRGACLGKKLHLISVNDLLECRRKHRCCNRALPCKRCERVGVECKYPLVPKKRGRPRKWPAIAKKQTPKSSVELDTLVRYQYNLREREIVFKKSYDDQQGGSYSEGVVSGNAYLPEISIEKRKKENERLPSITELLTPPVHHNNEHVNVANILLSFASGRIKN